MKMSSEVGELVSSERMEAMVKGWASKAARRKKEIFASVDVQVQR